MSKTNITILFMSLGTMIISSILVILKMGHHHKGIGENAGISIDNRLKNLAVALDKATQFVHNALQHTS